MDIKGKNVLVIGLAKSGSAAARLLIKNGANVKVTELNKNNAAAEEAEKLKGFGVSIEIGGHSKEFFQGTDFIVISPGVFEECPVIKWAQETLIPIISEVELASRFIQTPVIAVTGTNGKTTTTSLIAHILNENGIKSAACGNIGRPLSSVVIEEKDLRYAVCEVSSFQLERIVSFKPFISVFLNLTPDHLDRYPSIIEYRDAKINMFKNQDNHDWAVINNNYAGFLKDALYNRHINTLYFNAAENLESDLFMSDRKLFYKWNTGTNFVCGRDEIRLLGDHNLENIFSGMAAAAICGVPPEGIGAALKTFKAVSHRLEYVDTINGISFINDSKGTNVDSVVVALRAFKSDIFLIAGGRDKAGDFSPLRGLVRERVKAVIVIGEAAEKISAQLEGAAKIIKAGSLDEAVRIGFNQAVSKDTILLSPACASFDMFKNYEHRGDEFKRIVGELKQAIVVSR